MADIDAIPPLIKIEEFADRLGIDGGHVRGWAPNGEFRSGKSAVWSGLILTRYPAAWSHSAATQVSEVHR